ncbi:MAG: ornithine cyclodeaminase family protein, partial [Nitrososphaera sp.]
THINAIGADAPGKEELDPAILLRSKIVVDDYEQTIHSGEINVPISRGILRRDQIYGELGEIVAGKKPGRTSRDEVTVFDSTGVGILDVATAFSVMRAAGAKGLGLMVSELGL